MLSVARGLPHQGRVLTTTCLRPTCTKLKSQPRSPLSNHHGCRKIWIEALQGTASIFQTIHHSMGLDWYVTIPLVATLFNFGVRFPVSWYSTKHRRRRESLVPLFHAWREIHGARIRSLMKRDGLAALQGSAADKHAFAGRANRELRKAMSKEISRLERTWGVQRWKTFTASVSQIPLYSILLGTVGRLSGSEGSWTFLGFKDAIEPDPSLTTGGCLWFSDLTAADPYMLLPALAAALFWGRLMQTWGSAHFLALLGRGDTAAIPPASLVTGRLLILFPSVFLITNSLPSSVFLCIASSSALMLANEPIINTFTRAEKTAPRLETSRVATPRMHITGSTEDGTAPTSGGSKDASKR